MREIAIPRTMSTQHPDNAVTPPWSRDDVIQGDNEVYEAYFAYNSLGCHEVMWDSEGKDVDTRVIRKLLTNHEDYFREKTIGKDVFLTYRIPNPKVGITERKIVMETLGNIVVGYDIASTFYKRPLAPIFEVILPFTTDSKELIWLFNYYKKGIVGAGNLELDDVVRVRDWIGPLKPRKIEVIPLIEDMRSLLKTDEIVEPYINAVKPRYLRAFIARSDPALNYGLACAVILSKIALSKLEALKKRKSIPIYPIIGVGTMPFRGHLSPNNLQGFLTEYRGVYTATIQSAIKYDYPPDETREVIETLNRGLPHHKPTLIEPHEEQTLTEVLTKFRAMYQTTIEQLAPLINSVASYVPHRRARRLHIGLFGYSRSIRGIALPRAIPFAAALYTLGIPPEFIGFRALSNLTENERNTLEDYYTNMRQDLTTAAGYLSYENINMLMDTSGKASDRANIREEKLKAALTEILQDLKTTQEHTGINLGPKNLTQRRYENTINNFLISYLEQDEKETKECLEEAARRRRCLG